MTKTELRTAVKQEARVKVGTNLDDMIYTIFDEVLRDMGNKARYREVLTLDVPLTLVAAQALYNLPANFQHMQAVRFSADGSYFTPLYPFNDGQPRVNSVGFPRYYQLNADGILVYPSSQIVASNTLFLSYYRDPSSLFVNDSDEFPIPRLESVVKKMTIARIVRFAQQLKEADVVTQDASSSFVAGQGGQ